MLEFVQGDTAPDITAVLHEEDDVTIPVDLTDCTVRFQMRKADDRGYTVDAEADVIDELAGEVSYGWDTNDLAVPGDYDTQWEITYLDDRVQTTARTNPIRVRRQ